MKKSKQHSGDNNPGPAVQKEDIQKNPDDRIDQDFPGFPHPPSKEEVIKPETPEQKEIADLHEKDGEKINYPPEKSDEEVDDGSADAFDRTESVQDDE